MRVARVLIGVRPRADLAPEPGLRVRAAPVPEHDAAAAHDPGAVLLVDAGGHERGPGGPAAVDGVVDAVVGLVDWGKKRLRAQIAQKHL